ncbi:MAG TPA: PAS domain-containing protein, partial [Mucilaginibacter sp.]|nr:PAS domain-containing protein [Mucilaginibacter sp.]
MKEKEDLVETILHQEALINGVPDTIWSIDTKMCLITANQWFVERVKMATGKTIKQGDSVLIEEFGKERLNKWRRYYKRALRGEQFTIKEEIHDPEQQTTNYSLISLSPISGEKNIRLGITCYSKDITPDSLNLLALANTKERLEKIMDSSLDMICTVSEEGIILSVSA